MAQLTQGQLEAKQNLDRLMSMSPEQYISQYAGVDKNALIMADQRLQDMLTSSEGSYDPVQIDRLMREREALASQVGGREQMARQDYDSQLKNAHETVQWWEENPDGANATMRKIMPMVAAVMAVVATAGAASSAMGAAAGAGNTVAAGATVNGAVTAGIGTAAASGGAAAAATTASMTGMQVVTITGAKLAATAIPSLVQAAAVAGTVGAGAAAMSGGSAAPSAAAEAAAPAGEMQVVEVPGVRPVAGTGLGAALGVGAAVGAPLAINHAALEALPEVAAGAAQPGVVDAIKAGAGLIGNLVDNPIGTALTGAALTAALGATKDMPADPGLNSAVDKLNSNADAQMKEWNEWMYPQLKGALASNKAATDDFVGKANANAGQLEGMGASARGLGDLYNDRNNNIYIPLADKIIADANQFNKAGFAEQQSGLAVGDLSSAYAAQRQQQQQQRAQYGVDPSSGRAMAIDAAGGVSQAASSAAAATRARMAAEELWGKKQVDALGTSTVLNANAAGINASYANSSSMYTGATGLRNQGVKATSDYFTNASDLAKTSSNTYAGANSGYASAGQLGLGRAKIEGDRYIAEQEGRGKVIGAGLQAINSSGGVAKNVGDMVDTGVKIWNVAKGLWE